MSSALAQLHRSASIEMYIIISDLQYSDIINTYAYTVEICIDGNVSIYIKRYSELVKFWNDIIKYVTDNDIDIPKDILDMTFPGKLIINSFNNVYKRMLKINECLAQLCRIPKLRTIPAFTEFTEHKHHTWVDID